MEQVARGNTRRERQRQLKIDEFFVEIIAAGIGIVIVIVIVTRSILDNRHEVHGWTRPFCRLSIGVARLANIVRY